MPHQCTGCGHTFEDGSKEMLSGCPECGGNKFQFRPASDFPDGSPTSPDDGELADPPSSDESPPPDPDTSSVAETVGRATTKVRDFVSTTPGRDAADSDDPATPDPNAEWPDDWSSDPADASRRRSSGNNGNDRRTPSNSDDIIDADARRETKTDAGDGVNRDQSNQRGYETRDDRTDQKIRDHQTDQKTQDEDIAQASARSEVVSPDELDDQAADVDAPVSASAADPSADASHISSSPPSTRPDGEIVSEPTGEDADLSDLREQLNDQFESIKILEPGQYELNLMELYDREEYIIALQENGRYVIQVPEQWIGDDLDDR